MIESVGNSNLLSKHKIGFLAPSHVAPLSVLPTLDWAISVAAREDVAVMSGFSSQTERDVLSFLAKGKCGIILVLGRRHYKKHPKEWEALLPTNRLLIISTSPTTRQSKQTAFLRNQYICQQSDEIVMPSVPLETSSLFPLYHTFKPHCLT
ncbi:MAG: hypothetical protein LUC88_08190 [Prevotella sp.]|nr:hypothetical protein [Prevotella sp.]